MHNKPGRELKADYWSYSSFDHCTLVRGCIAVNDDDDELPDLAPAY